MGVTLAVPLGSVHDAQTPLSIVNELAVPFETCQLNDADWPLVMLAGEAVKLSVMGTATVTLAVVLPPGPVAVSMKVVVCFTTTPSTEPETGSGVASSVCCGFGEIVTEVALVVCQLKVVVWPEATVVGLAVNDVTCGGTGWATCTVTVCVTDPDDPVAVAE